MANDFRSRLSASLVITSIQRIYTCKLYYMHSFYIVKGLFHKIYYNGKCDRNKGLIIYLMFNLSEKKDGLKSPPCILFSIFFFV